VLVTIHYELFEVVDSVTFPGSDASAILLAKCWGTFKPYVQRSLVSTAKFAGEGIYFFVGPVAHGDAFYPVRNRLVRSFA
jgi:hypothetical protein